MASLVLSKILNTNPNNLTDQEKEDVYFELSSIECSPSIPTDQLRALFSLAQEVLKFKGVQVGLLYPMSVYCSLFLLFNYSTCCNLW